MVDRVRDEERPSVALVFVGTLEVDASGKFNRFSSVPEQTLAGLLKVWLFLQLLVY